MSGSKSRTEAGRVGNGKYQFAGALVLLAIGLFASLAIAVAFGSVPLGSFSSPAAMREVIVTIRLPRALLAATVGAALAISGVTMQTVLRNPLADPFILGISGGAAAGAAIASASGFAAVGGLVQLCAFAGALLATASVFVLARRREGTDSARLLLSGLVLNAFFSAVILSAFALSSQSDLVTAMRWMMGTLFGASWLEVALVTAGVVVSGAVLFWFSNDIRMLAFGEEDALSRGIGVERLKLITFLVSSLATGLAVSVSGVIGFVGLLVPHLVRLIWRRDFRYLLPLSALAGGTLLVLADLASRLAIRPEELPIGVFTALLGVPFFLSLIRRMH